jgi:hypothetical protein
MCSTGRYATWCDSVCAAGTCVALPELMARGLVLEDPRRDVVLMAQFSDSRLVVFVSD